MAKPENDLGRALVRIVDDDERVCQAIQELVPSAGLDGACFGFAKVMTGSRKKPTETKPCLGQLHPPTYPRYRIPVFP
jgi:hypothetical protein